MDSKLIATELAEAFARWPLPKSVCADACASYPNYPHPRSGTNLLTVTEAQQMAEEVFLPVLRRELEKAGWQGYTVTQG